MELNTGLSCSRKLLGLFWSIVFLFVIYFVAGMRIPANATHYDISGTLSIPSISLVSDVTMLKKENHSLKTPDTIVGSYSNAENKTLLIGHSSTVFYNLYKVLVGDTISYSGQDFVVTNMEVLLKSDISMDEILKAEKENTIIIMTCAGEDLGGGDATHRLILTAKAL